ncbi:MAG: glycosyltransferase [Lactobacillales bacterium]|jgi:rhamnosyltransferase|nr:glycosyltransferase [Lactobacillales bacterium]
MCNGKKIGLFIPTLNGEQEIKFLLEQIKRSGKLFDQKLAIDSESTDNTVKLLHDANFKVQVIKKVEFTHGRVRKRGLAELSDCDYVVMITQDIQPFEDAFLNLVEFIDSHKKMASAYGRQLVNEKIGTLYEARSRKFNYPDYDMVKSQALIGILGIKTIFQSDAFVVYDVKIAQALGSFPEIIDFAEDQYMAAQAILKGYTVGYAAKAVVYHQHNYSLLEEYHRFKAAGRFNKEYKKLLSHFGTNESEGCKYVVSEIKYYLKSGNILKIPKFLAINVAKYLGYKVGERSNEKFLSSK